MAGLYLFSFGAERKLYPDHITRLVPMSMLTRWSRQPMHVKLITIASVYAIIFPLLLILSNLLNWEGWSFKILALSNALEYDPIITILLLRVALPNLGVSLPILLREIATISFAFERVSSKFLYKYEDSTNE